MALFSLLAIGMTAILELPTLSALQTTQSSINQFPEGFSMNIVEKDLYAGYATAQAAYEAADSFWQKVQFGWEKFSISFKAVLEGMRQVAGNMGGGVIPTFKEGLPNLYCGVSSILLSFLFLFNSNIKLRDKLCSVSLLLFFIVSFLIRKLDYIWHGFHFTNMIPYRFSFLFSFVLLFMAYKAYTLRETFRLWQIIAGSLLSATIFLFSDSSSDIVYIAYNFVFLILYLSAILLPKLQPKLQQNATEEELAYQKDLSCFSRKVSTISLSVIITLEIIFNIVNFGVNFSYTTLTNYPKGTVYTASIIDAMQENANDLFYRTEVTHSQTLNDGALNGYNGISTFTSSANVKVTEFMKDLGYGAKNTYNRYCYEEGSPVSNLFLGIKYMIERDGQVERNVFFDEYLECGEVVLLKNAAYLPLGFLADSTLTTLNFNTTGDAFYFQNRLLKLSTGIEGDVWTKLSGDLFEVTAYSATILSSGASGYASYKTGESSGSVVFSFTADRDGFACINLSNLTKRNSYCVSVNGRELYNETYSLPQMLAVSDVAAGDVIRVRFNCNAQEQGSISAMAAVLDNDLFWKAYDHLNASTLTLTTFEDTFVEGTINCNRDGLLYTSIPQNGNWTAYVDGKKAEITLIGDAMIGLSLTEGQHTISFRYENAAFATGWKISLISFLIFIGIAIPVYRSRKERGKFLK